MFKRSITQALGGKTNLRSEYISEMNRIVEQYVKIEDFNRLVKSFIEDKSSEASIWGDQSLYTHHMFSGVSETIFYRGALTELLLLTLDIVDDLQDRDHFEKAWMKCSQELAINAVLALVFGVLREIYLMNTLSTSSPLNEVSQLILNSINGQYIDLVNSVRSEEDYMNMVQKKSSSLIRFAFYMGYVDTELPESVITQMNELADCVGVLAQMSNDLKDVLRFDLKNDLLQKKRTFPILFLLNDEEDNLIKQYYQNQITKEQFLDKKIECIQFIKDSGCVEYTKVVQQLFQNRANQIFESIDGIPSWKEKLREIILKN